MQKQKTTTKKIETKYKLIKKFPSDGEPTQQIQNAIFWCVLTIQINATLKIGRKSKQNIKK